MMSIGLLRVKWEVCISRLSIQMCRPWKCHPFIVRIIYKLGKNWTEDLVQGGPWNWNECCQGEQECSWGSCFWGRYGLCGSKTLNFKLSSWYLQILSIKITKNDMLVFLFLKPILGFFIKKKSSIFSCYWARSISSYGSSEEKTKMLTQIKNSFSWKKFTKPCILIVLP